MQNLPRPGSNLTLGGGDSWSKVHPSPSPNVQTQRRAPPRTQRLLQPSQLLPEAPTTAASRGQLVHVHLCGASPCRWVLARRICARVRPDLHNKSRLLPLSFHPSNFSTSVILHLPTEHTCIGRERWDLTSLGMKGLQKRCPRLWSSCPGSLSMPCT